MKEDHRLAGRRSRQGRIKLRGRWLGIVAGISLLALTVSLTSGQSDATDEAETATAEPEESSTPLIYEKWKTNIPGDYTEYNHRANLVQRGYDVYNKYCVACHGETGRGDGPGAERLITLPRDFTSGIYKFRSTDSGSLPLEADLYRTITRGLARVSMPAFPLMPDRDKIAVIEYIKGFYPKWEEEKDRRGIIPVPKAPTDLDESERIRRGRYVYLEMQCSQCHGVDGQGTGATQTEYIDAWGHKQKPFNFTRGSLKGGNSPEDIFRTFHTGLQSVMPAYNVETIALASRESFESRRAQTPAEEIEFLEPVLDQFPATAGEVFELDSTARLELGIRNSWDLVAYILSLRTTMTTAEAVLGPAHAADQ